MGKLKFLCCYVVNLKCLYLKNRKSKLKIFCMHFCWAGGDWQLCFSKPSPRINFKGNSFFGTPGPPGTPGCVSIPTKSVANYNFISANFCVWARGQARGPFPTLGSTLTPDTPKLHQRTHSPTRFSPAPSFTQIPPTVQAWLKDRVGDTYFSFLLI